MNAAEDRLSELMDAATRALNPPIEAMLAEGERRGRTRRRRRHAVMAVGTAAVVLLAAGGAAVTVRTTHERQIDADDGAFVKRSATMLPESRAPSANSAENNPTPSATPTEAMVPINAAAAVNILKRLVAAKWKFGAYDVSGTGSLLRVDVNDGKGLAQIFVSIAPIADTGMDPIDCSLQTMLITGGGVRPPGALPASCSVKTYANGDRAMREVLKADVYGEYQYRIIVSRSDGVAVEITVANGDWNNPATEVTRAVPPLTAAEWTNVALNRLWQFQVPANLAE